MTLQGQRVLVLGASGVLGGLIAKVLQERGAHVALAARNADRLARRANDLKLTGPRLDFDFADAALSASVLDRAAEALGGIDGVVNAAGVVAFGPLATTSDETLEELAATNLAGPLRVMRAAAGSLGDGFIVNISGVVAEMPIAGMVGYSAVKAGLSAATKALGRELRKQGVRVIDARPGHTETGLANRPIAGSAPAMPEGMTPESVAERIVDAIEQGERDLPPDSFS